MDQLPKNDIHILQSFRFFNMGQLDATYNLHYDNKIANLVFTIC